MERLFSEWAEEWLKKKRKLVKESTYATYQITIINHLIPAFGECEISCISTKLIQEQVLKWADNGKLDGHSGLSQKSIKDMVVILKACLSDYEIYYGKEIKVRTIGYPKTKIGVNRRAVLSDKEYKVFIETIKENLGYESLGYAITLYTGIRIGELCALKWGDIDLNERLIEINKTLQRIYIKNLTGKGKTKITITRPKSLKAVREIPISDQLVRLFDRVKKQRKDNYVLTGTSKYIEPRLYRNHYKKFLEKYKIEPINFHGLRHTFATRCIESGADCKVVSELLGHSSVNTTLNLYVHPNMEDKRRCVELL